MWVWWASLHVNVPTWWTMFDWVCLNSSRLSYLRRDILGCSLTDWLFSLLFVVIFGCWLNSPQTVTLKARYWKPELHVTCYSGHWSLSQRFTITIISRLAFEIMLKWHRCYHKILRLLCLLSHHKLTSLTLFRWSCSGCLICSEFIWTKSSSLKTRTMNHNIPASSHLSPSSIDHQ